MLYILSGGNGEELNKCSPPSPAVLLNAHSVLIREWSRKKIKMYWLH